MNLPHYVDSMSAIFLLFLLGDKKEIEKEEKQEKEEENAPASSKLFLWLILHGHIDNSYPFLL